MFKLGLSALFFTACATTGTTMETREPAPHAKVQLDLAMSTSERVVFPKAVEPRLPSVDRIAHQIRAKLGEQAVASIDLCVAPDGRVTKVSIAAGTSYAPFDAALLRDIEEWQFASQPGKTATNNLQTCERATVKYIVPN
jgi:TonB family protein